MLRYCVSYPTYMPCDCSLMTMSKANSKCKPRNKTSSGDATTDKMEGVSLDSHLSWFICNLWFYRERKIKSEVAAEARKVIVDLLACCSNQVNVDKCYLFAQHF